MDFKTMAQLILEARTPEEYYEEHLGKLQEFFLEYEKGLDAEEKSNPLLATIPRKFEESLAIIGYLKRNDHIQFFIPRIKRALIGWLFKLEYLTDEQKNYLNKQRDKVDKKTGDKVMPTIELIRQHVTHHFVHSEIPSIVNFNFTGSGLTYGESIEQLEKLETAYQERAQRFLNPPIDDPDGAELILQFKDSTGQYYEWVDLHTAVCPAKETAVMKHCGATSNESDSMLSLRMPVSKEQIREFELDKTEARILRKPVVTFAVANIDDGYKLVESHGIANSKPANTYHEAIVELFKKGIVSEINQRGAYKPHLTFQLDDLSSDLREEMDDLGIEEDAAATFSKEDIEDREAEIEEANGKMKFANVYLGEDDGDFSEEGGEVRRIEWSIYLNADELAKYGIVIPDDYRHNYTDSFSNWGNEEVYSGNYQLYSDGEYAYAEHDNLHSRVYDVIYSAEEADKDFAEKVLPQLMAKFPADNPDARAFSELHQEYLFVEGVDFESDEDGLIYTGTNDNFNFDITTETEASLYGKLDDLNEVIMSDPTFLLRGIGRPDPNQLELDLSSFKNYMQNLILVKEEFEKSKYLPVKLELKSSPKPLSKRHNLWFQFEVPISTDTEYDNILRLFNSIANNRLEIEGRLERLVNEYLGG